MTAPRPEGERTPREFSYRSARSGSLLAGLVLAILVETVVLHLWLVDRFPLVAWVLTVTSLGSLGWLVADHRAMGRGAVRLTRETVAIAIGRRFTITLPRTDISHVGAAGWRDVPEPGTAAASGYLNLTAPVDPNVILTLTIPTRVRLVAGMSREARRFGLHLDDPRSFVTAVDMDGVLETGPHRTSAPD